MKIIFRKKKKINTQIKRYVSFLKVFLIKIRYLFRQSSNTAYVKIKTVIKIKPYLKIITKI